jgi:hypothetical protein
MTWSTTANQSITVPHLRQHCLKVMSLVLYSSVSIDYSSDNLAPQLQDMTATRLLPGAP